MGREADSLCKANGRETPEGINKLVQGQKTVVVTWKKKKSIEKTQGPAQKRL